ncbi:MAG: bifunctional folylpolyglutamate synthase/dihydrofolate synthase [Calditrichia bacterium]
MDNITGLLEHIGNPQKHWPAIHLAGTNGKGSTAAFIYSVLKSAGYRTGLYTSPHLVDFRERIRVNDELIPRETLARYTSEMKSVIEEIKPTFFEATTALAFKYFAEQQVDIAVVETGLGGRLDATNLVQPLVTVITPIDIDHEQYLGKGTRNIAGEKAGIIKENIPCVINIEVPEVAKIFEERCSQRNAPFYNVRTFASLQILRESVFGTVFNLEMENDNFRNLGISLAGEHQAWNAALAAAALRRTEGFKITEQNLQSGLQQAEWAGRLQVIRKEPLTILDVAHNPHGFSKVFRFLKKQFPDKKIFVMVGLAKDKDYHSIADIIKWNADIVGVIDHFSEKELEADFLLEALKDGTASIHRYANITEGYNELNRQIESKDLLLIIGSHYLAGEFFQKIQIS